MKLIEPTWSRRAACRGLERSLFYSHDGAEPREQRVVRELSAKRVCMSCPVREDCLRDALSHHEPFGIWGGLNENERRALLRP